MTPLVVLIGLPGAGKTSVGRRVAYKTRTAFCDTDVEIQEQAGKPISEIFIDDGEGAFRALEEATVKRVLSEHTGVVSLGGGAVLSDATRKLLKQHNVIHLRVSLSDAVRRVGLATSRPVLAMNPRATLRQLEQQRTPLYEEVASASVYTTGKRLWEVAHEVLSVLRSSPDNTSDNL